MALLLLAFGSLADPQAAGPSLALKLADAPKFEEKILHQHLGSESVGTLVSLGLVGVMYARTGELDLSRLHVDLSGRSGDKEYCLRLNTRDAKYWALNRYVRVSGSGAVEIRSAYQDELKISYLADDLVARLTTGQNCSDQSAGMVIPIGHGDVSAGTVLQVYLNAPGDRIALTLVDEKRAMIAKATCSTDDAQGAVAYTQVCRFESSQLGGTGKRWMSIRRLGNNAETTVELVLPGH